MLSQVIQYLKSIKFFSPSVFISTANGSVSNSVAETSIIGTGVGSLSLPANFFTTGKILRIRFDGFLSTKAAPVGTLTLKFKLGATSIFNTGACGIDESIVNGIWQFDTLITCRSTGAAGTVIGQGGIFHQINNPTATEKPLHIGAAANTAAVVINTTAALTIDRTAQFSTADASNSITCTNAFIKEIN